MGLKNYCFWGKIYRGKIMSEKNGHDCFCSVYKPLWAYIRVHFILAKVWCALYSRCANIRDFFTVYWGCPPLRIILSPALNVLFCFAERNCLWEGSFIVREKSFVHTCKLSQMFPSSRLQNCGAQASVTLSFYTPHCLATAGPRWGLSGVLLSREGPVEEKDQLVSFSDSHCAL